MHTSLNTYSSPFCLHTSPPPFIHPKRPLPFSSLTLPPAPVFEGWYFKVTLPGTAQSFAFIYSVEDPTGKGPFSGVGAQVMGPDDGYLLHYSPNVSEFWGDRNDLALGAVFQPNNTKPNNNSNNINSRNKNKNRSRNSSTVGSLMVSQQEFDDTVTYGFQASTNWHQGSITARDTEGVSGQLKSTVQDCKWAFSVDPIVGWGDVGGRQRSTAGWLAAVPVLFEPHWQVLMAHGLASGWIEWGGERYTFKGAAAYAEKNWGGGFPSKWCWVQCNTFEGSEGTSVTTVGARRGLLNLPGVQEDVGLIGIHHQGKFYELSPKDSTVSWNVDSWGRWVIEASNDEYEAVVTATCDAEAGTPLRAPTADAGLAPFCKDSFAGEVRVQVWRAGSRQIVDDVDPIVDVRSEGKSGAVEVGGGPWFDGWKTRAKMAEPVRRLLNLPVDIEGLADFLPAHLKPPGY